MTVYPDGSALPSVSNVNYVSGQTIANSVIVPVTDGYVDLTNTSSGSTQLVADVSGYFSTSGTSTYVAVTPTRMLDTRTDPSEYGQCALLDTGQLPGNPNDVTSVILNMTVTETTSPGWLAEVPANETTNSMPADYGCTGLNPSTSDVNWTAADATVPNLDIAEPAKDSQMAFYFYDSHGNPPQLIVDAFGYFGENATPGTL